MDFFEEHVLFHFAYGQAMTSWAHLEHALVEIAASVLPPSSRKPLVLGYYAIENFRSKLNFCKAVVKAKFGADARFSEWQALEQKLLAASKQRNKLAHWSEINYVGGTPGRRNALVNWVHENYATSAVIEIDRPAPAAAMCVGDVALLRHTFANLTYQLMNLADCLCDRELRFPELATQFGPSSVDEAREQIWRTMHAYLSESKRAAGG
ncbi:hypothetical protein BH11PSE13_BH11PSE13_45080 [soil metagenome]